MSTLTFDTHIFVKRLKASGINEEQAEAIAEGVRDVQEIAVEGLARKSDINDLRHEIKELDLKINGRFMKVDGQFILLKWMIGLMLAGVFSLVMKAFFS